MEREGSGRWDLVVVGGGIVGLATARQYLISRPERRVLVMEKEAGVGRHQSGHNSGVLHAGIYYAPGSLKARLCQRGKLLMESFAEECGVPVIRRGKLVVAVEAEELGRFEALAERARRNGVTGIQVLGPEELREHEPHVAGLRALWSPQTGVIDFADVCAALAADIARRGGEVRTGVAVTGLVESSGPVRVLTAAGTIETGAAVSCAGLQADRLARRGGLDSGVRIVPFRGSWYELAPRSAALVNGNVYPVPDPRFPFLGVHFTRRLDGSVWAGPNAMLAASREGYRKSAFDLGDALAVATFPGAWRFARRNLRTGAAELRRDTLRRAALADMRRYVPALEGDDLRPGPIGIRAQAMRRDGNLVDDFLVAGTDRVTHVLNAPSPAATSSLAIAELLAARLIDHRL